MESMSTTFQLWRLTVALQIVGRNGTDLAVVAIRDCCIKRPIPRISNDTTLGHAVRAMSVTGTA